MQHVEERLAEMTKSFAVTRDLPSSRTRAVRPDAGLSGRRSLDLLFAGLLLALTAVMLLPGALTLPMELWDESRNANNAIEMARRGLSIVTTFGYVPDHWNTKPPLLIWMMAALLHTGLAPMIAVRLPSMLATAGSVLLVFVACRCLVGDRLAGFLGGVLLICSVLFLGDHVGRTGDYDALLCLLNLGFVLCAGIYIDRETTRPGLWIGAAALLLVLAVLAKGIAGGLAVPGLAAYAVLRRRLLAVLADWRLWLSLAAAAAALVGWLALREHFDPGYLAAVWDNDVAGRMLSTLDAHEERRTYYARLLVRQFEPAILLSPTLLALFADRDPARRRLCLLMVLTALSWLIALSVAHTKLLWYAAPIAPLLAVAIGVSSSTWLRGGRFAPKSVAVRRAMIGLPILVALPISFWYLNLRPPANDSPYAPDQVWYGPFMAEVRARNALDGTIVIDHGLQNNAGFEHYNPIARFFIEDAANRGEHMRLIPAVTDLPPNASVLSCDPEIRRWLASRTSFASLQADAHCVFGHLSDAQGTGR
jgi:4-amino-4-deoxy-L-arabinose transferase-like glycosyltransferase